jgi:hypothetical protein
MRRSFFLADDLFQKFMESSREFISRRNIRNLTSIERGGSVCRSFSIGLSSISIFTACIFNIGC